MQTHVQPTTPRKIVNLKSNGKKPGIEQAISIMSRRKKEQGRYLVNRKKADTQ